MLKNYRYIDEVWHYESKGVSENSVDSVTFWKMMKKD